MKKLNAQAEIGAVFGCGMIILVIGMICLMCGWTDRTLDFWCTYFSHHAVNVPMWMSCLITFIGNGVIFLLNLISEIARLCVGV